MKKNYLCVYIKIRFTLKWNICMNEMVTVDDEEVDNGGAIALKGFNYQNAVASLIAILNYDKDTLLLQL